MTDLRIAVAGTGFIGRIHLDTLARVDGLRLSAIIDPAPDAADIAASRGVPHFPDTDGIAAHADAVVVAAPNEVHVPLGTHLLGEGLPVLMEKPVAPTVADGLALAEAAERAGLPLLIGHHRRHNPIIRAAKAAIDAGGIGEIVTATIMSTLSKPDPYFDVPWRVAAGSGGPMMINVSHEVDLLRHFFGEIAEVTARLSNRRRGNPVEDVAALICVLASGAAATITATDAAAGPWAWDMTSGENPARFPAHDTIAHAYAGTKAALSLPDLSLWRHPGARDWTTRMNATRLPAPEEDGYVRQFSHFRDLILGRDDKPVCGCRDALGTMAVIEAAFRSNETGRPEVPAPVGTIP